MATWREFEAAEPDMAALGRSLLPGLAYLATVRRSGAPRLHPVCPFIAAGRLYVTTSPSSPKRFDLLRDGRFALHMLPGPGREEFLVEGRAQLVDDAMERAVAVEAALAAIQPGSDQGIIVTPEEWLFEYDIARAMVTRWRGEPPHGARSLAFWPRRP
jgi:hypothetical protein